VGHVKELDLERAHSDRLFRLDFNQSRHFLQFVLFHAPLHQRQGESSAVNRDIDFSQEIRHCADVVFMPVRQDEGPDLRLVFFQEGQVGHHQVDAQQFGVREHHAGVDHDDFIAVANRGHVHAELADSAQRDYL